MHFPDRGSPCYSRISEAGEGAWVQVTEGWTKRVNRGKTASPQTYHLPNSVRPDDGTTLSGLERLQADLFRPLGAVQTCPSALPDGILRWPGGQDARLRQPREDGLCCLPLLAVWTG